MNVNVKGFIKDLNVHYRQTNEASWGLKFGRLKNNEKRAKEYVTCRGVKRL